MDLVYNWQATLICLVAIFASVFILQKILSNIPALQETIKYNREEDKKKYKITKKYPHRVKTSQMTAFGTYIFYFIAVVPFFITMEKTSIWMILLQAFVLLMVYDFFYYLTHRFLFHGKGYFRQVHAVHHQARNPTAIDSLLLHPMEAFIGVFLFVLTTALVAVVMQQPLHIVTYVLVMIIYTQLNQLNHFHTEIGGKYKLVDYITKKHAIHHINMHHGNYATITLFYDKLFGTYE